MEVERRKLIVDKYLENPSWSGSKIAKSLNLPKTTVCRVLKQYKDSLSFDRKPQLNRRSGTKDKNLEKKVLRAIKQNPGMSDYDLSRKFKKSRSTLRRIRLRAGYKSYKAIKTPNRSMKQNKTAKTRARLLYDRILTKFKGCLLLDDETYVKLDFNQLPGTKFYMAKARGDVDEKYKFVKLEKFAKKHMIWQGICSCGLKTNSFITSSTMTSEVYMKECLQKRILPFIKKHKGPVKFWPDLASCHYSKRVLEWYVSNNVDFIPRSMNPPNCPDFRPIENYWAIMKGKLHKTGKTVQDINSLRSAWNLQAKKVEKSLVQKMMSSIKKKVRDFARNTNKCT